MTALKAHVLNGHIVVDDAVDLPEGAELRVWLYDASREQMSEDERARLDQSLARASAQADAGQLIDADEVLDELQQA
ncbi:MAG TPA: hypothetical protein VHE35_13205 [Kofleriaceae bacterium]|nr:hypothetical protein [Kofleriaceae bacterium]